MLEGDPGGRGGAGPAAGEVPLDPTFVGGGPVVAHVGGNAVVAVLGHRGPLRDLGPVRRVGLLDGVRLGGEAGELGPLSIVLDHVQPGALLQGGLAQRGALTGGDRLVGERQPVGVPARHRREQLPQHGRRRPASAVADGRQKIGVVPVGVQGDEWSDAEPVQRQAQVEQRGATRHALLAPGRVGGGQAALRIGPQLDHLRPDAGNARAGSCAATGPGLR